MNKAVLAVIIVLLLGAVGAYLVLGRQTPVAPVPTVTPITDSEFIPSDPPTAAEPDETEDSASSYTDPEGVFTLLHPSEYIVDSPADNHIRIFKRGDQDRPQGEISNGAMIVIERVNLAGKTLEEYVDERIETSTADGTSELVEPKTTAVLNNYEGYKYTIRGQGAFPQIVVQKDADSEYAVVVTTLVEDPQGLGYQEEVDGILATLQLLK